MMPQGTTFSKLNDDWLEVRGWTKDPFILTHQSTQKAIGRLLSRKADYTVEQFERNLSLYKEAVAHMGWPLPPEMLTQMVPPAEAVEIPTVTAAPIIEPPVQIGSYLEAKLAQAEALSEAPAPAMFAAPLEAHRITPSEPAEPQTGRSWIDEALLVEPI